MDTASRDQLMLEQYFVYATQVREVGITPSSFTAFKAYHKDALDEIDEIVRQITRQTS